MSTDNGTNMISNKELKVDPTGKGVVNRIFKENPSLVFIRDMCHVYNLIVEKALEEFPYYIIEFVKKLCAYCNVGSRNIKLKEIQRKAGIKEPLEMMSYCPTRWESLLNCTERTLYLWKYLETLLEESDSTLKSNIMDFEYYVYTYLLHVLLHKLIGYIIIFEKPNLLLDAVFEKIKESFTIFSRMLLKDQYQDLGFVDVYHIPFNDPQNVIYQEKLSSEKDFASLFLKRYPRIGEYLQKIQSNPKKNQCSKTIN